MPPAVAAVWREPRGLPGLDAGRRRGRPAGSRRARGCRRAPRSPTCRSPRRGAPGGPRAARRAAPGEPGVREPGRAARRPRRARPGLLRRAPRRRPVVVGGRRLPRRLGARVRRRRRGVGGLAPRRRRARGGLAGAGRAHADAGRARARRRAGRPRGARPAAGDALVPVSPSTTAAWPSARTRSARSRRSPARSAPATAPRSWSRCMRRGRPIPTRTGACSTPPAPHAHVHVLDRDLPAADKAALIEALRRLLSVHRSEGFGLTIAEAALLGKPVVATDYGGPRDWLTSVQRLAGRPLARCRSAPATIPTRADGDVGGAGPRPRGRAAACAWSASPRRRARRAARAREDVARAHDPLAVAGAAMAARLARIVRAPVAAAGGPVDARPRRGADAGARPARARRGGRRAAERCAPRSCCALAPYAVHQRLVDEELLRALRTLDERVRGLAAAPDVAGRRAGQAAPRARGLVASPAMSASQSSLASTVGVDVAGYLRGGLGLGQAARLYVAALQAAASRCGPRRSTSGCPRCTATTARARR